MRIPCQLTQFCWRSGTCALVPRNPNPLVQCLSSNQQTFLIGRQVSRWTQVSTGSVESVRKAVWAVSLDSSASETIGAVRFLGQWLVPCCRTAPDPKAGMTSDKESWGESWWRKRPQISMQAQGSNWNASACSPFWPGLYKSPTHILTIYPRMACHPIAEDHIVLIFSAQAELCSKNHLLSNWTVHGEWGPTLFQQYLILLKSAKKIVSQKLLLLLQASKFPVITRCWSFKI